MPVPSLDLVQQAIGLKLAPITYRYTQLDAALYALGIGAPADWLDHDELKFVYERSPLGFQAIPSFATIFSSELTRRILDGDIAGIKFNPMLLVHGEQYLEIRKPLPPSATVISRPKIANIYDKGSGLAMVIEAVSRDENGDALAMSRALMFMRGLGGFGGERGPSAKLEMPDRAPDAVHEETTLDIQALLYRLSGDVNPLHADPQMAAAAHFDRPILHGLSFFGFATRAILKRFCDNTPHRLKSIGVRFARHVFPGDTLLTEMWRTAEREVVFEMKSKQRGVVVLSQGKAEVEHDI